MADESNITGNDSITDYIQQYRDEDITFDTLHFKEADTLEDGSLMILLSDSILLKYKNELDDIKETKDFTEEEQVKYFCNPWRLSYDLYGTVEYWNLLLEANHLSSAIDFTQSSVIVYDGSLPDLISEIVALEEEPININTEEIREAEYGTSNENYDEEE